MHHLLRSYFDRKIPVTAEEAAVIEKLFVYRKLERKRFLLREGEIATHGALVGSGCLRSYAIDNKGKEHIIQFAPEDYWMTNLDSIRNSMPSAYFIDAIEDSELFLIDPPSFYSIMATIPAFAASFQAGMQKHAAAKDKRIIAALSATAEERYMNFIDAYPSIAQRVPQHMLASYLGVTPETISRIRKTISRKK